MSADQAVDLSPLASWLYDADDAVGSVLVAGVAFTDPDLPGELRALAARGRDLGLEEGARRVEALAGALARPAADGPARQARARTALDALHHVIGWTRLFRAELDLMRVGERLRPSSSPEPAATGVTRRLRPLGFELRGDTLTIWALDLADGQLATLVDLLADVDRVDPLGKPVISRLFQAAIDLRAVLGSIVELVDHPPEGPGSRRYAPAFATRPRLRSATGRPEAPQVDLDGTVAPTRPGWARLRVVARADRLGLRTDRGMPLAPAPMPALRTVLRKLLVREGLQEVALEALVLRRAHEWLVLAVDDPEEGVVYPGWDPASIGIPASTLARLAGQDASPAGLWCRAAVAWVGGAQEEHLATLGRSVAAASTGVEDLRLGMAARILGVERAATTPRVAGTDRESLEAVWLAGSAGLLGELPVDMILAAGSAPVREGDLPAIALRALLLAHTRRDDPVGEARVFVEGHVAALRRSLAHPDAPMPAPLDLVLFAEVVARLRGQGAPGRVVAALDLPRERLWRACVERLHAWSAGEAGPAEAGDTLLLAASSGVEGWVLPR